MGHQPSVLLFSGIDLEAGTRIFLKVPSFVPAERALLYFPFWNSFLGFEEY